MKRRLIIDGNAVYELDEDCMLKKRLDKGKEKREEQVKVINSLLELKRKVVGVKFYYDEEEYEACPAQQVNK